MINKLYINGGKPPKYHTYNKRIRRMVFNGDIIYEYIPCTGLNIIEETISIPLEGSVGDTYNIDYNISPNDCTEPVNWSIEDNSYFSISNGVLTRLVGDINLDVDELNILVTATCESYNDTINLSIINDRSCSSFKFNENQVSITTEVVDETYYKLKYTVTPDDCEDEVTYELSDPNIIKVTHSTGTNEFWITTLSMGTCIITATCGNFSDICEVTVNELVTIIPCEYVTVTPSSATLSVGDSVTITGSAYPSNTTDYMLVSSSDVSIIAIGNGSAGNDTTKTITVTAKAQGSVTITFNCNGVKGYCHITVN